MDPRIGTEFAGHRIEKVIGRGGVSVVYLAEHVRLGRKVALKVLAPHLAEDDEFRQRFIRESRMAAALDHPNIVTVYDAGEVEESLFISMRYVEGSDLSRLLRAEGALEPSRTILLLSQVAAALDAAHAHGLVHRDVKPANMLVEGTESGLERAYLSDFGISKRTTTGSGLTRTGQFVGTVDYVAPEQISGDPIDGRTDVYSLGCVLFQCVSGRVPFPGDTEIATIYRQLHDAPPSLLGNLDEAEEVDAVIAKALAKSKEDRYPTCSSLIEAARVSLASLAEAPTVARPIVRPDDMTPPPGPPTGVIEVPTRKHGPPRARWALIAGGALAVAVLVAVVVANLGGNGKPPANTGAAPPTQTSSQTTSPAEPAKLKLVWAQLKDPQSLAGDQVMSDVVAVSHKLVAVGHVEVEGGLDDAAVWVSRDTDRWRPSDSVSLTGPLDQRLLAVHAVGDRLIAGGWQGSDAALWTSTDSGSEWTLSSAALGPGVIRDFASLGSTLVAVGATGSVYDQSAQHAGVWTSTDGGVNWTQVDSDALGGEGGQNIWAVDASAVGLVAVGFQYGTDGTYDAAIWTSRDGLSWSRVDPAMFDEPGNQLINGIAGGTEGLPLVAVGCEDDLDRCGVADRDSDAAVWTSDDGEQWTKVDLRSEWLVGPDVQTMYAVSLQDGVFLAVGTHSSASGNLDGAVWTSRDGSSWNLERDPPGFVRALGGDPDDQAIRASIPVHRPTLSIVAVGVTDNGVDQDAVVWGA